MIEALKNWKLLLGLGIVAVLGILLAISRAETRHYHKLYDAAEQGRQLEIAKHAVTRQSLDSCIGSLNDMNAAVGKLKTDADARAAATERAITEARRASEGAEAKARDLEASAAQTKPDGACRGSAAYLGMKDEL